MVPPALGTRRSVGRGRAGLVLPAFEFAHARVKGRAGTSPAPTFCSRRRRRDAIVPPALGTRRSVGRR
jgi:hypothetical protein